MPSPPSGYTLSKEHAKSLSKDFSVLLNTINPVTMANTIDREVTILNLDLKENVWDLVRTRLFISRTKRKF